MIWIILGEHRINAVNIVGYEPFDGGQQTCFHMVGGSEINVPVPPSAVDQLIQGVMAQMGGAPHTGLVLPDSRDRDLPY